MLLFLAVKVSFRVAREEITKKKEFWFFYIYSVHINNKVHCNKMSLSIVLQECNTKLGGLHRTVI